MSGVVEAGVTFRCEADDLVGVLHVPEEPSRVGVVVVVGGPSYRVGSHRQFVLLARRLAAGGHAVLRFDYRGMGDSCGEARTFADVEDDIRAAAEYLLRSVPQVREVVLWGLCDAATAITLASTKLDGVAGLALLNPWVRSEETLAKAYVKRYYIRRALSRDFWSKALGRRVNYRQSVRELLVTVKRVVFARRSDDRSAAPATLAERMVSSLAGFDRRVLIILSGNDLTAAEFLEAMRRLDAWTAVVSRDDVLCRRLEEANHTFSTQVWRNQVENWTLEWLRES